MPVSANTRQQAVADATEGKGIEITIRGNIKNLSVISGYACNNHIVAADKRTDAKEICSFKLNRNGEWLIHARHMILSPQPEESDWDSYRASYSFGTE